MLFLLHIIQFLSTNRHLLSKASTLVAEGIHHVHLDMGGRSWGFGGNRRQEMKLCSLLTRCLNRLASTLKGKKKIKANIMLVSHLSMHRPIIFMRMSPHLPVNLTKAI